MKNVKIVVFVPITHANQVRQAMGDAGAGVWELGKYHHTSFSSKGIGRFIPGEGAHPTIGEVGKMSEVDEERIEVICEEDKVKDVISAIRKNHPYEEIPLEIYQLVDEEKI